MAFYDALGDHEYTRTRLAKDARSAVRHAPHPVVAPRATDDDPFVTNGIARDGTDGFRSRSPPPRRAVLASFALARLALSGAEDRALSSVCVSRDAIATTRPTQRAARGRLCVCALFRRAVSSSSGRTMAL